MGGWPEMDTATWSGIFDAASKLTVTELEGLIAGLKGMQVAKRTAIQRRAVVARNQRQQGIAIPRPRDPQSQSPDQSSGKDLSEPKPQ